MDPNRKTKISDLTRERNLDFEDLFLFSRDFEDDNKYDASFAVKLIDIMRAVRQDLRLWSGYSYDSTDKSLDIFSDDTTTIDFDVVNLLLNISSDSPGTSFDVDPQNDGSNKLNIKP